MKEGKRAPRALLAVSLTSLLLCQAALVQAAAPRTVFDFEKNGGKLPLQPWPTCAGNWIISPNFAPSSSVPITAVETKEWASQGTYSMKLTIPETITFCGISYCGPNMDWTGDALRMWVRTTSPVFVEFWTEEKAPDWYIWKCIQPFEGDSGRAYIFPLNRDFFTIHYGSGSKGMHNNAIFEYAFFLRKHPIAKTGPSGTIYIDNIEVIDFAKPGATEAPTNLRVAKAEADSAVLTWTDNCDQETRTIVERSISGGAFAKIDSVRLNGTSWTARKLTPGTAYSYRVYASNPKGGSSPSNTVTLGDGTAVAGGGRRGMQPAAGGLSSGGMVAAGLDGRLMCANGHGSQRSGVFLVQRGRFTRASVRLGSVAPADKQ